MDRLLHHLLQPFNDFERKASNADKHCPKHWYLIGFRAKAFRSSSSRLSGAAFATTESKIKEKFSSSRSVS